LLTCCLQKPHSASPGRGCAVEDGWGLGETNRRRAGSSSHENINSPTSGLLDQASSLGPGGGSQPLCLHLVSAELAQDCLLGGPQEGTLEPRAGPDSCLCTAALSSREEFVFVFWTLRTHQLLQNQLPRQQEPRRRAGRQLRTQAPIFFNANGGAWHVPLACRVL
jgi:hypothetical protein